jgi:phosphate-selective porin
VTAELEKVRAELLESRRLLSQVPGAVGALADVEARLGALQQEVARLTAMRASEGELRRELDALRARETELRERLAHLRQRLEAHRVELPRPAGFGHDSGGFFLRTDDGRFDLRLGGYLQMGYEGALRSTGAPHAASTYDLWRNLSAFELRRAKLTLGGQAGMPFVHYYVELDFARIYTPDSLAWHDESRALATLRSPLQDYYVDVAPWSFLAARVGQFRVPFGREHLTTPDHLLLVDRSVVDRAFTFDRDLGLMLYGGVRDERVAWQGAILNGNGANALHNTGDLLYVARLVLSPLGAVAPGESDLTRTPRPRVAAGGSFAYHRARLDSGALGVATSGSLSGIAVTDAGTPPTVDHVDTYQAGADLAFKWRGLSLQGEYVWRRQVTASGIAPTPTGKTRFTGAYGQAGYMVVKRKVEVAGRFAYAEPSGLTLAANRALLASLEQTLPRSVYEGTVGATYFHRGDSAKVVLDGSFLRERHIPGLGTDAVAGDAYNRDGWRLRLMLQLKF